MRARELRLRQSFQRIVMAVLAVPVAGAVGCHAPADAEPTLDATVPSDKDASSTGDAGHLDASHKDATISSDVDGEAPISDAACGSVAIDGTYIESYDGCTSFQYMPCGLPPTAQLAPDSCVLDLVTCVTPCESGFFLYCQLAPVSCDDAGAVLDAPTIVECISCNGIAGRRPLGLRQRRDARATATVGEYFAGMAYLEAASVRAFRDLAGWLRVLGAPSRLVRAARRSVAEERRHARLAARMARRFGGVPRRARVRGVARPSLVALLEDDAIEGCVKESFGALLATWQARHAADPDVREALEAISEDETRHAAFAWEILRWGLGRAKPVERRRVAQTLEKAVSQLELSRPPPVDGAIRAIAGHPSPDEERALACELAALVRREAIDSFGRNATETLNGAAVG